MSRLKINPQGFCVFCGRPGVTKEHVWPRWLHGLLPHDPRPPSHFRFHAKGGSRDGLAVNYNRTKQGNPIAFKVRAVCQKHCNSGWMSTLEQQARPILTPLIRGEAAQLGREEQLILAAWIAKTAMMFEHSERRDVVSTLEQRQFLMTQTQPPYGWTIWIGKYGGINWQTKVVRKSAAISIGDSGAIRVIDQNLSPPMNVQSITFGVGQMLVVVTSTSIADFTLDLDPKFETYTPQIWPFQNALSWPLWSTLNDADAIILSNGLNRMLTGDPNHTEVI